MVMLVDRNVVSLILSAIKDPKLPAGIVAPLTMVPVAIIRIDEVDVERP